MSGEGIRLETLIEIRRVLSDSSEFLRENCFGLIETNRAAWDCMVDLRLRQMNAFLAIDSAIPKIVIPIVGELPVLEAAQ